MRRERPASDERAARPLAPVARPTAAEATELLVLPGCGGGGGGGTLDKHAARLALVQIAVGDSGEARPARSDA